MNANSPPSVPDNHSKPAEIAAELALIHKNWSAIKGMKRPHIDVQLAAVRRSGYAIKYIENPAAKTIREALKCHLSTAVHYVEKLSAAALIELFGSPLHTHQQQLEAINRHWALIRYITEPYESVQLAAVSKNGLALKYIQNPTERVQLAAVKKDGFAVRYIENPSPKIQSAAVAADWEMIKYVDSSLEIVQIAALNNSIAALRYIERPSLKVQIAAVELNIQALKFIDNIYLETMVIALQRSIKALDYIDNRLPLDEIDDVLLNKIADPNTEENYIIDFLKSSKVRKDKIEFIKRYGSIKAKKILIDYQLQIGP